ATCWTCTAVFLALGYTHSLATWSLTACAAAAAVVAVRRSGGATVWALLQSDLAAIPALLKQASWPARVALLVTIAAFGCYGFASWASPLLGWDTHLYHMVHVVYWAQDQGFTQHPGIDAWGYNQDFPIG